MITVYAEHGRKPLHTDGLNEAMDVASASLQQPVVDADDQTEATRALHAVSRVRNAQGLVERPDHGACLGVPRIEGIRVTGHRWSWVEWLA